MKKAILMSRVSSDEQAKGYSLDVQEETLKRYCENHDIEIIGSKSYSLLPKLIQAKLIIYCLHPGIGFQGIPRMHMK
jgi:hypothetical protein